MKANRDFRSMLVTLLLVAAVVVAVVAIGCFGGGDDTSGTGGTLSGATTGTAAGGTTVTASVDPLSSFRSKNPFLAQAQATTTIVATTVSHATTTVSHATTTRSTVKLTTTTTAPHRLTVTAFPGGGLVTFTLDGTTLSGFGVGTAVFQGSWGAIQIMSVDDSIAPFTATFRRIGYSPDIVLPLNGYRTW
jgi:hypothetical protein